MSKFKTILEKTKQHIKQIFLNREKRTHFIISMCFAVSILLAVSSTTLFVKNYPDYIYIEDEDDLDKIRSNLTGDFVFTKQNINITKNWIPIGTKEKPFSGTILGNNCTISFSQNNFSFVNGGEQDYFGFFGYNEGSIKGLRFYLHDMSLTSTNKQTIFGCVSAFNKGSISTCIVLQATGKINITAENDLVVGGICGIGSHNFAKLSSSAKFLLTANKNTICSGIVGLLNDDTDMWQSQATSQIMVSKSLNTITGGLIGSLSSGAKFTLSNSLSKITFINQNGNSGITGGVVGVSDGEKSKIENVYSNCYIANCIGFSSSNFIGRGNFDVLNCVSTPIFINDTDTISFGSYAFEYLNNTVFNNCFFTKTYNNSFDYYGTYSNIETLILEKMGWDDKIWRKNSNDGFELI